MRVFLREAVALDRQRFKETVAAMNLAQADPEHIKEALRD
jgi:hypothetical protein